jgi:hypothetical protein
MSLQKRRELSPKETTQPMIAVKERRIVGNPPARDQTPKPTTFGTTNATRLKTTTRACFISRLTHLL